VKRKDGAEKLVRDEGENINEQNQEQKRPQVYLEAMQKLKRLAIKSGRGAWFESDSRTRNAFQNNIKKRKVTLRDKSGKKGAMDTYGEGGNDPFQKGENIKDLLDLQRRGHGGLPGTPLVNMPYGGVAKGMKRMGGGVTYSL